MGNQLAEERRHRAVRYEAGSIVCPLDVAAGFDRVVAGTLAAVIAGTRKPWAFLRRHSTPSRRWTMHGN